MTGPAVLPPVERVKVRWWWCGRLQAHRWRGNAEEEAADRVVAEPGVIVYGCPFSPPGRYHWHAAPLTADDLVIVAHVAHLGPVDEPTPDPRPWRAGEWVVTDPRSGRIMEPCPPPPTPSTSP